MDPEDAKLIKTVDEFAAKMKARLLEKRQQSFYGWDNKEFIDIINPWTTVNDYIVKGQYVDAADWLMFFWYHYGKRDK